MYCVISVSIYFRLVSTKGVCRAMPNLAIAVFFHQSSSKNNYDVGITFFLCLPLNMIASKDQR